MTKDQIERQERVMFDQWLTTVINSCLPGHQLNYFECNIEVWRQLWRVCEKSDIVVLTTDARFPLFHFPAPLYNYVVHHLHKHFILVLNKVDLVSSVVADQWVKYFSMEYPLVHVVLFQSFLNDSLIDFDPTKKQRGIRGRRRYENSEGKEEFLRIVRRLRLAENCVELPPHELKQGPNVQSEDMENTELRKSDASDSEEDSSIEDIVHEENQGNDEQRRIVVGFVGHPNTGKSSLINGIMKKKVVSTSRTPGHTKHFQTIILARDIELLDCPGLVFPALDRPKALQILCGLFPLAQVREPYSAIRYLAERIAIEEIYHLKKYEVSADEDWSPFSICEAYAFQRGYLTAKIGAPDTHRAGLEILRDCLDGKIVISWPPPKTNFNDEQLQKIENVSYIANSQKPPNPQINSRIEETKFKREISREIHDMEDEGDSDVGSEASKENSEFANSQIQKKGKKGKQAQKNMGYQDKLQAKTNRAVSGRNHQ